MRPDTDAFKQFAAALLFLFAVPSVATAQTYQLPKEPAQDPVWLGVQLEPGSSEAGVTVSRVFRSTPGERAGLQVGDQIRSAAGVPTKSRRELVRVVQGYRRDDKVALKVTRDGKSLSVSVSLSTKPDPATIVRREMIGSTAPNVSLTLFEAGNVHISEWKGKPTLIDFWATWCGPCRVVDRELQTLEQEFGDKINIVSVTTEQDATVRTHLSSRGAKPGTLVRDPKGVMHDRYLVSSFPMMFLLDENQIVRGVFFGVGHRDLLRAKLNKMLAK